MTSASVIAEALSGLRGTVPTRYVWERRTLSNQFRDSLTAQGAILADAAPSLELDNDRAVLRSMRGIELRESVLDSLDAGPFDPTSDNVAVAEERYIAGAWQRFGLGVFRLEIGDSRYGTDGEPIIECDAADLSTILTQSGPTASYTVASGTTYQAAIEAVLDTLSLPHNLGSVASTLPTVQTWPPYPETTWRNVIHDLADGINYRTPWPDGEGTFVWRETDRQPIGTNLVANPSFEVGTSGWSAVGGATISRVTSEAFEGSAALQVATDGSTSFDGAQYTLTMTAGITYVARAHVNAPVGALLRLRLAGVTETFTGTGGWQEVTLTAEGASLTNLDVINSGSQAHTYYVDDVNVAAETVPVSVTYTDADEPRMIEGAEPYRRRQQAGTLRNVAVVLIGDPNHPDFGTGAGGVSYAIRENADAASPISTATRPERRIEVKWDSSPLSTRCILDLATAGEIAETLLRREAMQYRTAALTTLPDPRRGAHEYVNLNIAGVETDTLWRVARWSRSLGVGERMAHELEHVEAVTLTEPSP